MCMLAIKLKKDYADMARTTILYYISHLSQIQNLVLLNSIISFVSSSSEEEEKEEGVVVNDAAARK